MHTYTFKESQEKRHQGGFSARGVVQFLLKCEDHYSTGMPGDFWMHYYLAFRCLVCLTPIQVKKLKTGLLNFCHTPSRHCNPIPAMLTKQLYVFVCQRTFTHISNHTAICMKAWTSAAAAVWLASPVTCQSAAVHDSTVSLNLPAWGHDRGQSQSDRRWQGGDPRCTPWAGGCRSMCHSEWQSGVLRLRWSDAAR